MQLFSERLEHLIKALGLKSPHDLAMKLGYEHSEKIQRLLRSPKNNPSYSILQDIANKFDNVNPKWLLTGEGEPLIDAHPNAHLNAYPEQKSTRPDVVHHLVTVDQDAKETIVMVPQRAAASYAKGYADPEYISTLPAFNIPKIAPGSYRAFEVEGDSMFPTLYDGDIVVCSEVENLNSIQDSYVHVIVTDDGVVIKRAHKHRTTNELELRSDNTFYTPYREHYANIREVWKVRRYISAMLPAPTSFNHRLTAVETAIEELKKKL